MQHLTRLLLFHTNCLSLLCRLVLRRAELTVKSGALTVRCASRPLLSSYPLPSAMVVRRRLAHLGLLEFLSTRSNHTCKSPPYRVHPAAARSIKFILAILPLRRLHLLKEISRHEQRNLESATQEVLTPCPILDFRRSAQVNLRSLFDMMW